MQGPDRSGSEGEPMQPQDVKYVGFRARFIASMTDSILIIAIVIPPLAALRRVDILFRNRIPAAR